MENTEQESCTDLYLGLATGSATCFGRSFSCSTCVEDTSGGMIFSCIVMVLVSSAQQNIPIDNKSVYKPNMFPHFPSQAQQNRSHLTRMKIKTVTWKKKNKASPQGKSFTIKRTNIYLQ